jgi:hypothetical protein
MNLFDSAKDQLDRVSGARHEGYAQGHSNGRDTGRTETLNNVHDAIDSSSVATRVSKKRLHDHIDRNA